MPGCALNSLFSLSLLGVLGASCGADVRRGPVPPGGACVNEGDFSTGNHCVMMRGAELDAFQDATKQDFGVRALTGGASAFICISN